MGRVKDRPPAPNNGGVRFILTPLPLREGTGVGFFSYLLSAALAILAGLVGVYPLHTLQ